MEEDSSPYRKPHFKNSGPNPANHPKPIRQGKSGMMQFLFKAVFFAVFVMVLPMFPSQAPDFINNHALLTKFWELIHLVFIGIAVSYGLFSTRNAEMGFEDHSNVGDSESYMPKFFPVSSSFDDGYENPCGSGEKRVVESRDSQYFVGNPGAVSESNESTVFGAQCKPSLPIHDNGIENSCGYKEKNVAQAWNSQYFQGESVVFVAQPNYGLDEWGKARSIADNEPLGLPIRSLKSRVRNQDSEFVTRGESGAGSMTFPNGSDKHRNGKFGDLSPINLEEKLNEAAAAPSAVHLRSSSGRMEKGKRVGEAARPSHFRPLSVDEAQFESLKTRSFRSTLSFSSETSQTSSMSTSPKRDDSFANSMSSEVLLNSRVENLKKRKSSQDEFSSLGLVPAPKPISANEKVSMSTLHSRGYSIGSFNEEDLRRRSRDYLKELSGSGNGSEKDSKELGPGFLGSNIKPTSLSKSLSRGKSVRTIRASRLTTHDKVENMLGNGQAIPMRRDMQNGGTNNKNLGTGPTDLDFDNFLRMAKPTIPIYQKMQDFCGNAAGESEEDSESEAESFQASSKDRVAASAAAAAAKCNPVNVAGPDSEVDKKAGEFIAKFRAQIRLQRVVSIDRSRGLSINNNCVR